MSPEPEPARSISLSLVLAVAPSVSLAISLFVCSQRQANWNNPEKYCWLWFGAAFCFGFTHRFFCSISVYFVFFFPDSSSFTLHLIWHGICACMTHNIDRQAAGERMSWRKKTSERKLTAHHLHPSASLHGKDEPNATTPISPHCPCMRRRP